MKIIKGIRAYNRGTNEIRIRVPKRNRHWKVSRSEVFRLMLKKTLHDLQLPHEEELLTAVNGLTEK
jgi:hypothetical protein